MSLLKFGDPQSIYRRDSIARGQDSHLSGMYAAFGHGPEGKKCEDCAHFRDLRTDPAYTNLKATGKCIVYETTFPNRFKGWLADSAACAKFEAE